MTDHAPDAPAAPAAPDPQAAQAAKAQRRRDLRRSRRDRAAATSPQARAAVAEAMSGHAIAYLAARGARRVAAFDALPTEVPTRRLLDDLVAAGYVVLVPVLLADKDLDWQEWPAPHTPHLGLTAVATCDVVLVPALAVDRDGRRLGQGGGSYDRALPRRAPGAPVVALVADEEYVDGPLPVDAHDCPVDAVLTPSDGLRHLPAPR